VSSARFRLEAVVGAARQEHGGEGAQGDTEALERPHGGLPSGHAARMGEASSRSSAACGKRGSSILATSCSWIIAES
jgi:hypothetical protein